MRTKFHIIVGSTTHELSTTDIKNWDEVKFTLERKDYSGVTRTFSSQFEFVGSAYTLLRDLYLTDGFLASAYVAVSTKNNDWTYTEQFRCPLDFSTIEIADGVLTISSIDNTLAGLLKAKKSTKFEWPVSDFTFQRVSVARLAIVNSANFRFTESYTSNAAFFELIRTSDAIVTTEYIEPKNQTHIAPLNEFFAKVTSPGATLKVVVEGVVRCPFCPYYCDGYNDIAYNNISEVSKPAVADVQLCYYYIDPNGLNSGFRKWATMFNNDIYDLVVHGSHINALVNFVLENTFFTLEALKTAAAARWGANIGSEYNGVFGVVGSETDYSHASYWENNTVYEFQNGQWINKGAAKYYYQDRNIIVSSSMPPTVLTGDSYAQLKTINEVYFKEGIMHIEWADPIRADISCRAIRPLELATKIVQSISPIASVEIDTNEDARFEQTFIVAGEELRQIGTAKVYSTFQQFADWIEAVFGYSYKIENGTKIHFTHRSNLFGSDVVKVFDFVRDVKFSIDTDLIYAEVQAGYAKKDYGEINGRYEKNFTNYYTTGYNATDKKLQLISKYRADVYGIEFTARKSESETKDDKADEDVFVLQASSSGGTISYSNSNTIFSPAMCVDSNKSFIAALGNGKAITLTMTSSDGDNELSNISIVAGTALFTASQIEFKTDDMIIPEDWDGVLQFDHGGYRFKGYISKAEASYGRQSGVEYTLIVKSITKL